MTEQQAISDELRADLMRVWSLGFLKGMAGRELEDTDEIPTALGDALIKAAEKAIRGSESFIQQIFQENPSMVYQTVFNAGYELASDINDVAVPIEVNLN